MLSQHTQLSGWLILSIYQGESGSCLIERVGSVLAIDVCDFQYVQNYVDGI